MERGKTRGVLKLALFLALLHQGAGEYVRDLQMCGEWIHGKSRNVWFDVGKGCGNITIAANETTLSIQGDITGNCENSSTIPLPVAGGKSLFCVFWEPLLDLLEVNLGDRNYTLCKSAALQESCCAGLSSKGNKAASGNYGIVNGSEKGDFIETRVQESFKFYGHQEDCQKDLCSERSAKLIEEMALRSGVIGQVDLPCAQVSTQRLGEGFQGREVILQASALKSGPSVTVWLPPSLAPSVGTGASAVLTYYKENTLFQTPEDRILDEVVGISLEGKVVSHLAPPLRLVFRHAPVAKNETTRCVFWDTNRDPAKVTWRQEGCETRRTKEGTECRCDHLTYFAILVELKPSSSVDNLEALTYITSVCCAISLCSCVALVILYTRALRRMKKPDRSNSSIPIHLSLAISLLLLCALFVLTGVLANVGGEEAWVCRAVGAALHYALLCSFSWMGLEVLKAFWLVHWTMDPFLSHRVCSLLGFGLPAFLVVVFVCINGVYGTRDITPSSDITSPYSMCWIMDTPSGWVIHYLTNVTFPVAVVIAGLGMLVLVLNTALNRKEWGQNQVTFLSIWGLSCLFGCTWGLGLLNFGPLSAVTLFLFCIINGLQGFFLLVRFYLLEWMTKRESVTESRTTDTLVLKEVEGGC
ncbi:adhesion G protein-coupled receptor G3-like [Conger conger]|uniref:adhesion G protein-coupled receptor G3-like n=1 Tax=Conger conger TaxID=82655 RepID=UPI002A5AAAC4|nr:adhesion G protein-coupled receptor G3-like [Conger conger]